MSLHLTIESALADQGIVPISEYVEDECNGLHVHVEFVTPLGIIDAGTRSDS